MDSIRAPRIRSTSSYHLFEVDGRPVEVEVHLLSPRTWRRLGDSLRRLYSAAPAGRGWVRLVRLEFLGRPTGEGPNRAGGLRN